MSPRPRKLSHRYATEVDFEIYDMGPLITWQMTFSYYDNFFWASPLPTKMFEGAHAPHPPLAGAHTPPCGRLACTPPWAPMHNAYYMCLFISIIGYTVSNFLKYV